MGFAQAIGVPVTAPTWKLPISDAGGVVALEYVQGLGETLVISPAATGRSATGYPALCYCAVRINKDLPLCSLVLPQNRAAFISGYFAQCRFSYFKFMVETR